MRVLAPNARRLVTASRESAGFVRLAFNVAAGKSLALRARVFPSPTGREFLRTCPHQIDSLTTYGAEVYGPLRMQLPSTSPQPRIPPGGLAYSQQGAYLCIFFGQLPAWPVDYIAQIDDGWEALQGGTWRDLTVSRDVDEER